MTTGGAVPRSGQHSQEQQQWEPSNDPRSIGPRQSRDYCLNLVHYNDKRRPGSTPLHRYQLSHFMQIHAPEFRVPTQYCFSVYSQKEGRRKFAAVSLRDRKTKRAAAIRNAGKKSFPNSDCCQMSDIVLLYYLN